MGWVYPQYREFRLRSWHIPRCSPDMTSGLLLTTCWRKSALRSCHCLVVTSLWCKKQTHGLCANKQLEVRSETSLPLDEVTSEKISSQWRWAKKVVSWKQLRCWTRVMTCWISSNVCQPLSWYKWLGTSKFGAHSHRWACATQSFQVGGTSCCSFWIWDIATRPWIVFVLRPSKLPSTCAFEVRGFVRSAARKSQSTCIMPYPRPCICVAWWRRFTSVAHRWPGVGRMLGCRILLHFHPFGQRILIFGCMTARRCARCSLGVFQLLWPACYEGRPNVLQAVQCNGV